MRRLDQKVEEIVSGTSILIGSATCDIPLE